MRLKPFLCCTSLLVLLALPAVAEPLAPRGELSVKGGTDRSLLTTEFWAPLAQQSDRVLYGDIRLMGDNDENREGNLGLGYRQIKNDAVIGMHGWIDRRRTQHNSTFHQLTFGLERLGHIIDARVNIYIPINNSRIITTRNIGVTTPYLAGSGIYYDTNGSISETPQYGLDGELGYRLPILQKQIDAIRVYGGGYYFFRDNTVEVPGIRFRSEAQINKIVSIGARVQYDKPRGTQGFLEATLKFPFSAKRLYQESGIHSRLDESPERDIDIVTESKVTDTGLKKPVLNTATGTQQRILYVDNSKADSGDGSYEKPFNTLKSAEAALQANDILYVNRGDGTTRNMDQGLVINKANVTLIGSGSQFTYNGYTLLDAGSAPVITNKQASTDVYTGNGIYVSAINPTIKGVTVTASTTNGIYIYQPAGTSWDSLNISNVNLQNNGRYGLLYHNWGGVVKEVEISHLVSNSNLLRPGIGIFSEYSGNIDQLNIHDNTTNNNANNASGWAGIYVSTSTSGFINNINISDNIASSNSGMGIRVFTNNDTINSVLIQRNQTNSNTQNGIYIGTATNGVIQKARVIENTANNNTQSGIYAQADNGRLNDVYIGNNAVNANAHAGIRLEATGINSFMSNAVVVNNVSTNNTTANGNGFLFRSSGTATLSITATGNTASGNAQSGYLLQNAATSGIYTVMMQNNNAISNIVYGVNIDNDAAAAVTYNVDLGGGSLGSTGGNRIYNNTSRDVYVDTVPLTGSGTLVYARNNWWGVNTGLAVGRRTLEGTSTIDSTAFLTTDPRP